MLTLREITAAIERVSDELEDLVGQITTAGDDAAQAEVTFKAEYAKARLSARAAAEYEQRRITTDEAEDRAVVATEGARLGHLVASNGLMVLREALRAKQARLDALRTLAASYRGAGG